MLRQRAVRVHRRDAGLEVFIAQVDHCLLTVQTLVHTLRRVELAAIRRNERECAHLAPKCCGEIVDRARVADDQIVTRRGDLHRARADDYDISGVGRLALIRRVDVRRLLGRRFRRIGHSGRIRRLLRCGRFRLLFVSGRRVVRRIRPRQRLLLFLNIVQRLAAVFRAGAAADHEHAVLLRRAGVVIEFIERAVQLQHFFPPREGVGVIRFKSRDEAAVQQR